MISDRTELRKSMARRSIARKARKFSKTNIRAVLDQIEPLIGLGSTESSPTSSLSRETATSSARATTSTHVPNSTQTVPVSSPSTESFTSSEMTTSSTAVSTGPYYADLLATLFPFDQTFPNTETRLKKRKENQILQIPEAPLKGPRPRSVPDNSLCIDLLANIDDAAIKKAIKNTQSHQICTHESCPIKRPHSADQFNLGSPQTWTGQPPHEISESIERIAAFEEEFAASELCRLTQVWIGTPEYKQHQTDKAFMEARRGMDASRAVVEKMLETKERLAVFYKEYEASELYRLDRGYVDTVEWKRNEADKEFLQAYLANHATKHHAVN